MTTVLNPHCIGYCVRAGGRLSPPRRFSPCCRPPWTSPDQCVRLLDGGQKHQHHWVLCWVRIHCSLYLEVQHRTLINLNLSNRQDAHEALNIASMGKIHCHYVSKPLSALSEYVSSQSLQMYCSLIRSNLVRVYEGMQQGTVAGRVVLKMD
jgi:hypothetical protein